MDISLTLLATVLLTFTQSSQIIKQQIGVQNYAECKSTCESIATGLATAQQIKDYLAANGGIPYSGEDVWTPINDEDNGWLQIGDSTWDYERLHSSIPEGPYPSWGTQSTAQTFKKIFYCFAYTTCSEIWNGALYSGNANTLIGTSNTYELTIDGQTPKTGRCIFAPINDDGEVFVGTMFEHFSLSDATKTRCGWNDDGTCTSFISDNLDGIESSQVSEWYRWNAATIKNVRDSFNTPYLFVTCNGITDLNGDYLLMPFAADLVDRPDDISGDCFQVDSWTISGYPCENTMGRFWMNDHHGFHIDSTLQGGCANQPGFNAECGYIYPNQQYPIASEDVFGYYYSVANPSNHECSANPDSTTSYFMGEIVEPPPPAIGCAFRPEIEVIPDAIYACPGIFSGGIFGTEADALCNDGYSVCEGAEAAAERGLNEAICYDENIFTNPNQFFASRETSDGGWDCYAISGVYGTTTDDIWGCSNPNFDSTATCTGNNCLGDCLNANAICTVDQEVIFTKAIGNCNVGDYWSNPEGARGDDASVFALTDAEGGGVLCCKDIFCANEPATFDWDTLTDAAIDVPEIDHTIDISTDTLSLNIRVELDYEGYASADYESGYGVTYVLDFEDFDAYKDNIYDPGTCQNRVTDDFYDGNTLRPFDEWWKYSLEPALNGHIGDSDYMAYPPSGDFWNVSMLQGEECTTIVYEGSFTWNELVACSNTPGGTSYVTTKDEGAEITLSGVFYVNVVSPFWKDSDKDYYRVYQLLSHPFTIAISKTVYVLGDVGVNILTISVIAVYKENAQNEPLNDFRLVVLTESQQYLELTPSNPDGGLYLFEPDETDTNVAGVITQNKFTSQTSDTGCLNNKQFICSQLWEIQANNLECKTEAIDFSGTYTLQFETNCRTGATHETYCAGDGTPEKPGWLAEHPDIADGVTLTTHLTWRDEICDPQVMNVQFEAEMKFYTSDGYTDDVLTGEPDGEGDYLFEKGANIYVEIDTDFADPKGTANIFDTQLTNVWICTFEPGTEPDPIVANTGLGGCMDANRDGGCENNDCFDDNGDNQYFYHIYQGEVQPNVELEGFTEITTGDASGADILRFYFTVPKKIARDKLYVHAQVEVTLQATGQRRRMLLRPQHSAKTANQMDHFIKRTGLTDSDNNNNKRPVYKPDNNYNPQPQQPINNYPNTNTNPNAFVINLSSPWIIGIGGILSVVLICNIIFMCYMNCNKRQRARVSFDPRRRNGYSSVKNIDSDVCNDSEVNAINVVSDQSD